MINHTQKVIRGDKRTQDQLAKSFSTQASHQSIKSVDPSDPVTFFTEQPPFAKDKNGQALINPFVASKQQESGKNEAKKPEPVKDPEPSQEEFKKADVGVKVVQFTFQDVDKLGEDSNFPPDLRQKEIELDFSSIEQVQ